MMDGALELEDVRGPSALGGGWRRSLELLYLMASTEFKRNYFGTALMDTNALGSGARALADGVDTSGPSWSPLIKLPNVEANEQWYPIIFVSRHEMTDGAGAG